MRRVGCKTALDPRFREGDAWGSAFPVRVTLPWSVSSLTGNAAHPAVIARREATKQSSAWGATVRQAGDCFVASRLARNQLRLLVWEGVGEGVPAARTPPPSPLPQGEGEYRAAGNVGSFILGGSAVPAGGQRAMTVGSTIPVTVDMLSCGKPNSACALWCRMRSEISGGRPRRSI